MDGYQGPGWDKFGPHNYQGHPQHFYPQNPQDFYQQHPQYYPPQYPGVYLSHRDIQPQHHAQPGQNGPSGRGGSNSSRGRGGHRPDQNSHAQPGSAPQAHPQNNNNQGQKKPKNQQPQQANQQQTVVTPAQPHQTQGQKKPKNQQPQQAYQQKSSNLPALQPPPAHPPAQQQNRAGGCRTCGQEGHYARECPNKNPNPPPAQQQPHPYNQQNPQQAGGGKGPKNPRNQQPQQHQPPASQQNQQQTQQKPPKANQQPQQNQPPASQQQSQPQQNQQQKQQQRQQKPPKPNQQAQQNQPPVVSQQQSHPQHDQQRPQQNQQQRQKQQKPPNPNQQQKANQQPQQNQPPVAQQQKPQKHNQNAGQAQQPVATQEVVIHPKHSAEPAANHSKCPPSFTEKYNPPASLKIPKHLLPNLNILMIAEKPSIALAISKILSEGNISSDKGFVPVQRFSAQFQGHKAKFTCSSVAGHVYGTDFPPKYQNWSSIDPEGLFDVEVVKVPTAKGICKHLQSLAKGIDVLILWLDCDKEGENICFEVMENCVPAMNHHGHYVFRARFSAISAPDISRALNNLTLPNKYEALSVDARQEIDMKVGCAFSRFQTQYFLEKYADLDSNLISYGPCQIPTLGFVVDRYDEIISFRPRTFWRVVPTVELNGSTFKLSWSKGREFNNGVAVKLKDSIETLGVGTVVSCKETVGTKQRPQPLNTVELLKIASSNLNISPHTTMHVAETLYIQGFISYPRTESSRYPEHFDFDGVLKALGSSDWGTVAKNLLQNGINKPRAGHDAGDHPPITPMKSDRGELDGTELKLYNYITQHFLGSLMPDCKYITTTTTFQFDKETFSHEGKKVQDPGFTAVMTWLQVSEDTFKATCQQGDKAKVLQVKLEDGQTSPPDYLSESDLIGLMEKHGIGTDASIATHINTVQVRNYVKPGHSRTLIPTKLGLSLVKGYHSIDGELVLPKVRAQIEASIVQIAKQTDSYRNVVNQALGTSFTPVFSGQELQRLHQQHYLQQGLDSTTRGASLHGSVPECRPKLTSFLLGRTTSKLTSV